MAEIRIGTMGWSYGFWAGNFYPKGMKTEELLTEYSKHFNTVEIDTTFYRVPSQTTIEKWKNQTPSDFLFSAKFPRVITHVKMLRNCEEEVERFIESVARLRGKLGPLLLQFPSTFRLEHKRLLGDFLSTLPKKHRYAVEIRNRELAVQDFFSLLREHGAAFVLQDRPSMPKTDILTADFTYIRWEGDRNKVDGTTGRVEVDRTVDIRVWANKITELSRTSVEVFGYFSKYYSGHPPTDVKQLLDLI